MVDGPVAFFARWRVVAGFPSYDVCEDGRIRNAKTYQVLKPFPNRNGYARVTLMAHGRKHHKLVHLLVAEAFLGPCPEGHVCDHKNAIRADARLENLEYVTPHENERRKLRNRLMRISAMLDLEDAEKARKAPA